LKIFSLLNAKRYLSNNPYV